jgi:hypothetical protein
MKKCDYVARRFCHMRGRLVALLATVIMDNSTHTPQPPPFLYVSAVVLAVAL